jgi:hypothetical protein
MSVRITFSSELLFCLSCHRDIVPYLHCATIFSFGRVLILDLCKSSSSPVLPSSDEILAFSERKVPVGTFLEEKLVDRSGGESGLTGLCLSRVQQRIIVSHVWRQQKWPIR